MRIRSLSFAFLLLMVPSLLTGCGDDTSPDEDAGEQADSGNSEAGMLDAGRADVETSDTGESDTGEPSDTGTSDTGEPSDTGDGGPMACMDPPTTPDRPAATICTMCRPPGDSARADGECASDADCASGDNGRCISGRLLDLCTYDECFEDSDCEDDEFCACDTGLGNANSCIEAGCRINSDCPGSHTCASSLGSCGNYAPPVGYYCHTDDDECTVDADCAAIPNADCRFDDSGPDSPRWVCSDLHCVG